MALSSARVLAWGGRRKGFPDMLGEGVRAGCAAGYGNLRGALAVEGRQRRMRAVRLVSDHGIRCGRQLN